MESKLGKEGTENIRPDEFWTGSKGHWTGNRVGSEELEVWGIERGAQQSKKQVE